MGTPSITIFTIGYEGLTIDAFIALLAEHGVETLVDVLELPPLNRQLDATEQAR